jgi:hypothetical protein
MLSSVDRVDKMTNKTYLGLLLVLFILIGFGLENRKTDPQLVQENAQAEIAKKTELAKICVAWDKHAGELVYRRQSSHVYVNQSWYGLKYDEKKSIAGVAAACWGNSEVIHIHDSYSGNEIARSVSGSYTSYGK